MAPRAMATGTVSFGLVAIPVKLYSARERSRDVRFNLLHEECGSRVKRKYYCPTCDEIVERDDLIKGYEFAKGQYVTFTGEELDALRPESTQSIDITEFVPVSEVDPIFYDKPYFLGPDKGGVKPYRLLMEAMRDTQRVAIARYAARGKLYLVLLRPMNGALVMQQLHYADEIRSADLIELPEAEIEDQEMTLARQLIDQIASDDFDPADYEDEAKRELLEKIERKVEGEEITAAPEEEPKAQVIDLMSALKASLGEEGEEARKPPKRAARKEEKASGGETAEGEG